MTTAPGRLVVIGASAGGVEALTTLVRGLDPQIDAAVLVVLHVPTAGTSFLPRILTRAGALPAAHPEDGDALEAGRVYVAPPNRHLVVSDGTVALSAAPRENGHRPAVNPLFRSAARTWGPRVVAVVLSGSLDDGAAGAAEVKRHGGLLFVQDPESALQPDMPQAALRDGDTDFVGTSEQIAARLGDLPRAAGDVPWATEEAMRAPSIYTCPDCGGVMAEVAAAPMTLQCHVGHTWSGETLLQQQGLEVERAMWVALRTLRERGDLLRRMESHARDHGLAVSAERFGEELRDVEVRADQLARALHADDEPNGLPG